MGGLSAGDWGKAGDLVEAVTSCNSRDAARAEVAAFMEQHVGMSAAFIGRAAPPEVDAGYIRNVPHTVRDRFLGGLERYGESLRWHVATASALGGVARHPLEDLLARGDLIGQEILEPVGPKTVLGGPVTLGGRLCGVFYFGRRDAFGEDGGAGILKLASRVLGMVEMLFGDIELPCFVERKAETKRRTALSRREREVLEYLALGYTNAQIGLACDTSMNTVKRQVAAVFRKLDVSTRAEAVRAAMLEGHLVPHLARRAFY